MSTTPEAERSDGKNRDALIRKLHSVVGEALRSHREGRCHRLRAGRFYLPGYAGDRRRSRKRCRLRC